ncbi:MAG: type II toxin-antitoxin system VapC family toxin [Candidatus Sericytochromatia bacterium]|nr:type II toxin-antitoxin system VapC family toxin [Candidatus Tanganyikabacteria bacterium]
MLVADTHAWLWWTAGDAKLSDRARAAMEGVDEIGVCTHSLLEIAWLVRSGRLELQPEVLSWLKQAIGGPGVTLLPLTPEVAVTASRLTELVGRDPADCVITATAMLRAVPLVTRDASIRNARVVETIW